LDAKALECFEMNGADETGADDSGAEMGEIHATIRSAALLNCASCVRNIIVIGRSELSVGRWMFGPAQRPRHVATRP